MNGKRISKQAALVTLAIACTASTYAFSATSGWYRQPWTPPAASHSSRVEMCGDPRPNDVIALDDFGVPKDSLAVAVRWWGVILDKEQLDDRPYLIAFYGGDNDNCEPTDLLYVACVIPQIAKAGIDCTGAKVMRFTAPIPAFAVTGGQRYWIQISEVDDASANIGVDDFRWSSHQPVRGCPAIQENAEGQFRRLEDACNDNVEDLAFNILFQAPAQGD